MHGRILAELETLAAERLAEQVDRLAPHALRGEVWNKAVTYCQQAGARAHDHAALREAVASFEQALQALAHLPEPGAPVGWPSSSASLWEAHWAQWESMGGASPCGARPKPWPGGSPTGPGWDGYWPRWPLYAG